MMRSGVDLSQTAAYVRNECRANAMVERAYNEIDFTMDGPVELPGPVQMQILPSVTSRMSEADEADGGMDTGSNFLF